MLAHPRYLIYWEYPPPRDIDTARIKIPKDLNSGKQGASYAMWTILNSTFLVWAKLTSFIKSAIYRYRDWVATVTKTWGDPDILTSIAGVILEGQAWLMDWWSTEGGFGLIPDLNKFWSAPTLLIHFFCVLGQNVKHKLRNSLVQNTRSFPQSLKQRTS